MSRVASKARSRASARERVRRRNAVVEHTGAAWALAIAAGFVVVAGFQVFRHAEVGPMTGNIVSTSSDVARQGTAAQFPRAFPIVAFIAGVAAGIVVAEECARRRVRRALGLTLGLELLLLVPGTIWLTIASQGSALRPSSHWQLDAMIAVFTAALGLQTAALRRVGGQTVRTVYMTGMITRATEEAVRLAYWRSDRRRGTAPHPWRNEPTLQRVLLLAGLVIAYIGGALLGAWMQQRWGATALIFAIAVVAVVAVVDSVLDLTPPSR